MGPNIGPKRPQKGAILRPKSGRIGSRIGLAGLEFPSRSYVDPSKVPFAFQELFCTCFRAFGGSARVSGGPTACRPGAVERERERINPSP